MKNQSLSNRKLYRYMRQITEMCGAAQSVQLGSDFEPSEEFLLALRILAAKQEILCKYSPGRDVPYFIRVLPEGMLHFYAKSQRRAGFWIGFFSGLILGLAPVLFQHFLPDIVSAIQALTQRL